MEDRGCFLTVHDVDLNERFKRKLVAYGIKRQRVFVSESLGSSCKEMNRFLQISGGGKLGGSLQVVKPYPVFTIELEESNKIQEYAVLQFMLVRRRIEH